MKEHTQNTLVGLFMLGALGCLVVLILLFNDAPILSQDTYEIEFLFDDSGGANPGDKIHLNGKQVGTVTAVRFQKNPGDGVIMVVRIYKNLDIPRSYRAEICGTPMGGPWIGFKPVGNRAPIQETEGFYTKAGPPERVPGLGYSGYSMLPGDLKDALAKTAAALSGLLGTDAEGDPAGDGIAGTTDGTRPASRPANLATAIDKIAKLAESLNQITGDSENQRNIKDALADLRRTAKGANEAIEKLSKRIAETADEFKDMAASAKDVIKTAGDAVQSTTRAVTEDLSDTLGRANDLIAKFAHDADELGKVLAGVRKITDGVAAGRGTVGKLLRDEELYRRLIELLAGLQGAADELKTLVVQWRTQGIRMKF